MKRFFLAIVLSVFGAITFYAQAKLPLAGEKILSTTNTYSAKALLAFGREARENKNFEDALTFFNASLQSNTGKKEFLEVFTLSLLVVDAEFEQKYAPYFTLTQGRPEFTKEKNRINTGLFGLNIDTFSENPTTGIQSYQITFEFFGIKKPQSKNQKATEVSDDDKAQFFHEMIQRLAVLSGTNFPNNPLRFIKQERFYLVEGVMNTDFPQRVSEAYWELAETYRLQGDYPMAIRYYQNLLGKSLLLSDSDRKIQVLYRLIDIYQVVDSNKVAELARMIIELDPYFDLAIVNGPKKSDNTNSRIRSLVNMIRKQNGGGVDQALTIFRFSPNFSIHAHQIMGILNYLRNNTEESLAHISYAVFQILSLTIDEIRKDDYFFQYKGLNELISLTTQYSELNKYLSEIDLYQSLYYLGLLLEKEVNGYKLAEPIWKALAENKELTGQWAQKAASRLR